MKYLNKFYQNKKSEKGSLVIEATVVFPVTFLVLFFLLFLGNMYYQRSLAQSIMTREAIKAAAAYSNPMVDTYISTGAIPACNDQNDFRPYRYIFPSSIAEDIKGNIEDSINNMGTGLFSGMGAQTPVAEVEFNSYGVYATAKVDMTYKITMPIKLLGQDNPFTIRFDEYIEISAMEGSEMVRNVTMVIDIMETFGASIDIQEYVNSNPTLEKFFTFIN